MTAVIIDNFCKFNKTYNFSTMLVKLLCFCHYGQTYDITTDITSDTTGDNCTLSCISLKFLLDFS